MKNNFEYFIKGDATLEKYLKAGQYIDSGHNGIIYMLPNNRILKVFKNKKICNSEYYILKRASKNSKHFPKVYEHGDYYIVRDYVSGSRLDHYIKKNGLCETLSKNLVNLILEFKKIGFTKLDIRCKDLYVQEDLSLMVIDPKKNFTKQVTYPRHLMKGLNNLYTLENFLETAKRICPDSESWGFRMNIYLTSGIK